MMQRLFFLIIFLSFHCLNSYESKHVPTFNSPDLGKTHFIIGLPANQAPLVKKSNHTASLTGSLEQFLLSPQGTVCQAFFSPDDDVQNLLIQLINNEQKSIKTAIFSFTDGDIAHALINAHKRGVTVEIITDISSIRDKFNKIELLKKFGVVIYVYNPRTLTILNNIMHHKFVLFGKNVGGKSLLWTGSFNFTKSAKINNQENIVILDQIHLINRYNNQFELLKERITKRVPLKSRL